MNLCQCRLYNRMHAMSLRQPMRLWFTYAVPNTYSIISSLLMYDDHHPFLYSITEWPRYARGGKMCGNRMRATMWRGGRATMWRGGRATTWRGGRATTRDCPYTPGIHGFRTGDSLRSLCRGRLHSSVAKTTQQALRGGCGRGSAARREAVPRQRCPAG
jgi:hypothetical protein